MYYLLLQVGIPLSQLLYSTDPFTTYLTCATTLANGTMRDGDLLPGATPLYSSAYLASSSGIAPRVRYCYRYSLILTQP